jgi:hypothetical protein
MAKKGNSAASWLKELRDLVEDVTESWPEHLPHLFRRDEGAKHSRALQRAADYFQT